MLHWLSTDFFVKHMKISILIRRFPILTYSVFCVLFGVFAFTIANLGSYDDGGIGLVGVILILIWSVIAFPFSIPMEILGPTMNGNILGGIIGLLLCSGIEILVKKLRRSNA